MNKRPRQFRYVKPVDGSKFIELRVNVLGPCDRSVSTLAQLASELHASVPFNHRVDVQPRVSFVRPPGSLDEVAVVDMVIEHGLTTNEACALLRDECGYLEEEH